METENKNTGIDFNAMDNKTKFVLGSATLGLISCFLPLIKVKMYMFSFSASLFDGGGFGWFMMLGFIGIIVFKLAGDKIHNVERLTKIFIISVGVLWGFFIVLLTLTSWGQGVSPEPTGMSIFDFIGFGFYITSISVIGLVFSYFTEVKE